MSAATSYIDPCWSKIDCSGYFWPKLTRTGCRIKTYGLLGSWCLRSGKCVLSDVENFAYMLWGQLRRAVSYYMRYPCTAYIFLCHQRTKRYKLVHCMVKLALISWLELHLMFIRSAKVRILILCPNACSTSSLVLTNIYRLSLSPRCVTNYSPSYSQSDGTVFHSLSRLQ